VSVDSSGNITFKHAIPGRSKLSIEEFGFNNCDCEEDDEEETELSASSHCSSGDDDDEEEDK